MPDQSCETCGQPAKKMVRNLSRGSGKVLRQGPLCDEHVRVELTLATSGLSMTDLDIQPLPKLDPVPVETPEWVKTPEWEYAVRIWVDGYVRFRTAGPSLSYARELAADTRAEAPGKVVRRQVGQWEAVPDDEVGHA